MIPAFADYSIQRFGRCVQVKMLLCAEIIGQRILLRLCDEEETQKRHNGGSEFTELLWRNGVEQDFIGLPGRKKREA